MDNKYNHKTGYGKCGNNKKKIVANDVSLNASNNILKDNSIKSNNYEKTYINGNSLNILKEKSIEKKKHISNNENVSKREKNELENTIPFYELLNSAIDFDKFQSDYLKKKKNLKNFCLFDLALIIIFILILLMINKQYTTLCILTALLIINFLFLIYFYFKYYKNKDKFVINLTESHSKMFKHNKKIKYNLMIDNIQNSSNNNDHREKNFYGNKKFDRIDSQNLSSFGILFLVSSDWSVIMFYFLVYLKIFLFILTFEYFIFSLSPNVGFNKNSKHFSFYVSFVHIKTFGYYCLCTVLLGYSIKDIAFILFLNLFSMIANIFIFSDYGFLLLIIINILFSCFFYRINIYKDKEHELLRFLFKKMKILIDKYEKIFQENNIRHLVFHNESIIFSNFDENTFINEETRNLILNKELMKNISKDNHKTEYCRNTETENMLFTSEKNKNIYHGNMIYEKIKSKSNDNKKDIININNLKIHEYGKKSHNSDKINYFLKPSNQLCFNNNIEKKANKHLHPNTYFSNQKTQNTRGSSTKKMKDNLNNYDFTCDDSSKLNEFPDKDNKHINTIKDFMSFPDISFKNNNRNFYHRNPNDDFSYIAYNKYFESSSCENSKRIRSIYSKQGSGWRTSRFEKRGFIKPLEKPSIMTSDIQKNENSYNININPKNSFSKNNERLNIDFIKYTESLANSQHINSNDISQIIKNESEKVKILNTNSFNQDIPSLIKMMKPRRKDNFCPNLILENDKILQKNSEISEIVSSSNINTLYSEKVFYLDKKETIIKSNDNKILEEKDNPVADDIFEIINYTKKFYSANLAHIKEDNLINVNSVQNYNKLLTGKRAYEAQQFENRDITEESLEDHKNILSIHAIENNNILDNINLPISNVDKKINDALINSCAINNTDDKYFDKSNSKYVFNSLHNNSEKNKINKVNINNKQIVSNHKEIDIFKHDEYDKMYTKYLEFLYTYITFDNKDYKFLKKDFRFFYSILENLREEVVSFHNQEEVKKKLEALTLKEKIKYIVNSSLSKAYKVNNEDAFFDISSKENFEKTENLFIHPEICKNKNFHVSENWSRFVNIDEMLMHSISNNELKRISEPKTEKVAINPSKEVSYNNFSLFNRDNKFKLKKQKNDKKSDCSFISENKINEENNYKKIELCTPEFKKKDLLNFGNFERNDSRENIVLSQASLLKHEVIDTKPNIHHNNSNINKTLNKPSKHQDYCINDKTLYEEDQYLNIEKLHNYPYFDFYDLGCFNYMNSDIDKREKVKNKYNNSNEVFYLEDKSNNLNRQMNSLTGYRVFMVKENLLKDEFLIDVFILPDNTFSRKFGCNNIPKHHLSVLPDELDTKVNIKERLVGNHLKVNDVWSDINTSKVSPAHDSIITKDKYNIYSLNRIGTSNLILDHKFIKNYCPCSQPGRTTKNAEHCFLKNNNIVLLPINPVINSNANFFSSTQSHSGFDQINDLLSNLKSNMAKIVHEFKTPINTIIGLISELIKKQNENEIHNQENYQPNYNSASSPKDYFKTLSLINHLSNYLIFLTKDIIQFCNIGSNGQPDFQLNFQKVKLKGILDFCFEILKTLLYCQENKKGIKPIFLYDKSLEDHEILTDEIRLKQVILNLISNSVKFTKSGSISLECRLNIFKKRIKITIIDTGIGIKNDDQHKLFKDFVMLTDKLHMNNYGSGLGLSICKLLANKLKYKLKLRSKYGEGTKFNIYLEYSNIYEKHYSLSKLSHPILHLDNTLNKKNSNFYEYNNSIDVNFIPKKSMNKYDPLHPKRRKSHSAQRNKSLKKIQWCENYNEEELFKKSNAATPKKKIIHNNIDTIKKFSLKNFENSFDSSESQMTKVFMKNNAFVYPMNDEKSDNTINVHELFSKLNNNYNYNQRNCGNKLLNNSFANINNNMSFNYIKSFSGNSIPIFNNENFNSNNFENYTNRNRIRDNYLTKRLTSSGASFNNFNIYNINNKFKINNNNVNNLNNCRIKHNTRKFSNKITNNISFVSEKACYNKSQIIVVDDQKPIRDSLKNNLKTIFLTYKKDYDLIDASDGIDTLKFIMEDQKNRNLIKCIFTDENMEYMNGSQSIKIIRQMENDCKIKKVNIVSVTSFDDEFTKEIILSKGANFLIDKPCNQAALIKILGKLSLI